MSNNHKRCAGCKSLTSGTKYCTPQCGNKHRNRRWRAALRADRQLVRQMREALK